MSSVLDVPTTDIPPAPAGPGVLYLLGHDAASASPWTLTAFTGSTACWSTPLDLPDPSSLDTRAAQYRAQEILADHGVRVVQWHTGMSTGAIVARAVVSRQAPAPTPWDDGSNWLG